AAVEIARGLLELGFLLVASRGTAKAIAAAELPVTPVNKVSEGRPHIVDLIKDRGVQLVVNTTEGQQAIRDSFSLRREALVAKLPYYTTIAGARAVLEGLRQLRAGNLAVTPLQTYVGGV